MDVSSPSSSSNSPSSSLVSRARTALHSAAAKAEKVLTDITSDLKPDRDADKQSRRRSKGRLEEGSRGRSEAEPEEFTEKSSMVEVHDANMSKSVVITSVSVVKHLAVAIENVKDYSSLNGLLDATRGSYHVGERASLSFSAVKSLVLREKDKSDLETVNDEENRSLITCLLSSEEPSSRYISASVSMDLKDIHGAPIRSFVVRAAEIIGSLKSLQKMASFWLALVAEIKKLWDEGKPIPHIPLDEKPDLNYCLLHQQLQAINCCVARKARRAVALEDLDSIISQNSLRCAETIEFSHKIASTAMYAKTLTGEYVLRLGADQPFDSLTMLDTGEAIYSPVTQDGPILTEEHIREAEEFVLRTGSLGAGCSQLLSDMQAFKAANPGCILEDFIRWHSPPDWTESVDEMDKSSDVDVSAKKGRLSKRMQKQGNLWLELWETAKPLPAVQQAPLFDEDLAVESIFATLEEISPSELFEQLFISILFSSIMIVGSALSMENSLSKVFDNCKDYIIAACHNGVPKENLKDLCKVYETLEMILVHPQDAIELTEQDEETNSIGLFRKFGRSFTGRRRQSFDDLVPKEQKKTDDKGADDKGAKVFSNLFERRRSLFSSKNKRNGNSQQPEPPVDDNSWTVI